jgi:hypothetical protein
LAYVARLDDGAAWRAAMRLICGDVAERLKATVC